MTLRRPGSVRIRQDKRHWQGSDGLNGPCSERRCYRSDSHWNRVPVVFSLGRFMKLVPQVLE